MVRAACRATPPMRMAPSRSNFPYPAPITCIEARREGCHLREIEECPANEGPVRELFLDIVSARRIVVRSACAVKPCAFGAPLTRLWGLTAGHDQTRGIRALMEYLCRLEMTA